MKRTVVWEMVSEAINALNGSASYSEIENYIIDKWSSVNKSTIEKQIIAVTVNHKSRVHYRTEGGTPRLTNSGSDYDILYKTGRGQVVRYDSDKHGVWEIYLNDKDKLEIRAYDDGALLPAYLFIWNPNHWSFDSLTANIEHLKQTGKVKIKWSCVSHKKVKIGDRAFLLKLGTEPKGIFGSGYIVSEPFLSQHWSGEDKQVYRVLIEFDVLINPTKEPILGVDRLLSGKLKKQLWLPQVSGISINPDVTPEFEELWFKFLTSNGIIQQENIDISFPTGQKFTEGNPKDVIQTRYERNPYARNECLKFYGYACSVCEFDFLKYYGDIGRNFIHVHHLTKISSFGNTYEVDPIQDLRPVCPNCHAMLHKRKEPFSIDELKLKLPKRNNPS